MQKEVDIFLRDECTLYSPEVVAMIYLNYVEDDFLEKLETIFNMLPTKLKLNTTINQLKK
jgi:hypothetical protein